MINMFEVNETNKMITQENLDVRTITMGISLLDCISDDLEKLNQNIYDKITPSGSRIWCRQARPSSGNTGFPS